MVSKNNKNFYLRKSANKVSKYAIKKLSVGVASVLLSTAFFLGTATATNASAAETEVETKTELAVSASEDSSDSSGSATSEATTVAEEATTEVESAADSTAQATSEAADATNDIQSQASEVASEATTATETAQSESATQESTAVSEATTSQATPASSAATLTAESAVETASQNATSEAQTSEAAQTTSVFRAATTTATAADSTEDPNAITVSSWAQLVSAMGNSSYSTINVNGALTATSNNSIGSNGHTVTVKGADGASINFGSYSLTATGGTWNVTFDNLAVTTGTGTGVIDLSATTGTNTVTFKDVTATGTSLYGGGGTTDVIIDGTTTSTVDNASTGKANTYSATSREANIHSANSVTIADGATFTLNRSSIGDGINLPSGSTVTVGDNATFTVNMNTNNATDSARYHNAGIFMEQGGSFITGRNSVVTMNTSIGQAVSIGVKRPADSYTDTDRWGGYTENPTRYDGPTVVTFGEYSTFNFTGRDGFMLGDNATFTSGEYSTVHFQNQGRGVALDLGDDSNIIISKHSNTLFESDGKGPNSTTSNNSGGYSAYNYIGVDENSNILIDEYATFRVILTNRGDNDWDDVISLNSKKTASVVSFTSKQGAVVDIRDDNTNFYAELISFPLGTPTATINIEDPLYLNLQRYSAGGETTGWMPVGGTNINSTSNKYTANLIYIGGTNGKVKIGGTDYVVYQQIKSDGTQQIWLNVNEVEFAKNGFQSLPIYDNGANEDVSISGSDLVAGILANAIKDNQTDPTVNVSSSLYKDAPYYGISTMRASHQIWFPHTTVNEAAGKHTNTIVYVYEDGTTAAPTVTQEVDMVRDLTLSLSDDTIEEIKEYAATHTADEILNYIKEKYAVTADTGWTINNAINTTTAYDAVTTPTISGYTASIQSTNANGVSTDDASSVHAILEIPEAIVENGQLTDAYKNNGTTGIPENYVTVVVYKKEQQQTATITYVDSTTGETITVDTVTGDSNATIDYSTADKIKELEEKGYVLVEDGFPTDATFDDDTSVDQNYTVTLKHGETTVTPENPVTPGDPINPNDPDGPKWPAEAGEVSKDVTLTVTYSGAGDQTPADNVQTATWTRTVTVDNVTGEVVSSTDWTSDKTTYDAVTTPVITGYYADTAEVTAQTVTQDDITIPVVYKELGKIIPVDEDGNEIPGAETPTYNNDPSDPTQAGETPTPTVPGYHTETSSVDPDDPGSDTKVVYVKDQQTATITYVDSTTGETIAVDTVTGDSNATIDYSTADKIKELEEKGYVLVEDGFPTDATFDDDTSVDQNYTVTLKHGETTVTPENPVTPGDPINPNDPDGPKWPAEAGEVSKDVTLTVTYSGAGDQTPADNVQTATWTRTVTVDNVTGEVISSTDWTSDKTTYDAVTTPVITGYYADTAEVTAQTVTQDDITIPVVYKELGKIIPVDEDGNEIPGAETPTYNNDPSDPTQAGETPTPTVPGYHTETPSVDPTDPGSDTKVVYVKDDVNTYTLTENFVDENGNKLADSVVKGTDYEEGTDYDVSGDAKVIDGYYLTEVPSNATGTIGTENVTVDFVYKELGKIVPVDPDGNPIPGAETPTYNNDPSDPTKGGITDVPEVPGYVPQVPNVTPENPGEDTPVVYVPVTPEVQTQTATITYVDSTTGETITVDTVTGESGSTINYSTADKIKELEEKGYVLVEDGFPTDATFDDDTSVDQNYTVTLKHGEETVTPENPVTPGDPINPNDPDGPKWPAEAGEVSKDVTLTVTYSGAGDQTPADNVQNATWSRTVTVDKVTGEVVSSTDWTSDKETYDAVTTPVITGYYADTAEVTAQTVTQEDITIPVVYKELGKIVPVDPDGNPIPGAETPTYNNDPSDPTKGGITDVPEVPGYVPQVPSVTPENPGEDTPVVYVPVTPEVQTQTATITYVDSTTGETITVDTVTGESGSTINYSTADMIKELEDKGYVLVEDGFPTDATFDDDTSVDQNYTVTLKHGETTVTPENPVTPGDPINPNDPDGPKWPAEAGEVSKDVTLTVTYSGAGDQTPADNVQTATWTRTVTVDNVTGEVISSTDWTADKTTYDAVTTPVITGYYADTAEVTAQTVTQEDITIPVVYKELGKIVPVDPDGNPIPGAETPTYNNDPSDPTKGDITDVPEVPGYVPQVPNVTPENPGEDTPVVYVPVTPEKQNQTATITYVDSTTGETITVDTVTGESGSTIDYSTADKIKELEEKGYVLVEDGFPTDATFDDNDNTTQNYTVTLKHGEETVTPENPVTPGDPINPNDPDGPKWPAEAGEVSKDVTSTVHYVGAGDQTPADNVQTATWTREVTVDKVTGEVVSSTEWTSDKTTYDAVTTPVIDGYYADTAEVAAQTVTQDNLETTVVYKELGKIVPVDPNGNPIPGAETPTYNNDPSDPTKGGITDVPEVPGYVPQVPNVTPENPGEDTPVVYVPVTPEKQTQTATITYVDSTTGETITVDTVTGESGSTIDYSTADKIKELEEKGYVLVEDGFPSDATFDDDDNTTQNYTVTLKHGEKTVTPENPVTPGDPINPNDPDGPKWPAEAGEVSKDVTSTVHYVGAGDQTPVDNVQTATWTREVTVDAVTGEVISSTDWTADKETYDAVTTPVINGYYADTAEVAAQTVTQDNLETTVVYKELGKIVPVDPNGNPIPGAETPTYNNDPSDPTKGGITDVPEVPGYVPQVPNVTPENPGENTNVVYVPVTPEKQTQTAKIVYVDETTGETIETVVVTGKSGDKIDYSTADKIKELIEKGYVVVEDGFPTDATFDDNDAEDQVYVVKLGHDTAPVGPNNPHEPGTPINPNDPNGPKWPAADEYSKEYTSTVHFVDENGNKIREDDVQTSTWTRTLIIDKVTGEILNPQEPWTADKDSYNQVKVPVVEGYVADKAVVPGQATQQQNLETTVTYKKIGVIVPVDENGNPIPGAETPQYENDPNDPTKVIVTDTPKVPGYTTDTPSVDPADPTANTQVVYKKVVTPDKPSTPTPQPEKQPDQPQAEPQKPVVEPTSTTTTTTAQPAKATQAAKTTEELPQTGDSENNKLAALGATMVASLLGFAGLKRRKKDEKDNI